LCLIDIRVRSRDPVRRSLSDQAVNRPKFPEGFTVGCLPRVLAQFFVFPKRKERNA